MCWSGTGALRATKPRDLDASTASLTARLSPLARARRPPGNALSGGSEVPESVKVMSLINKDIF